MQCLSCICQCYKIQRKVSLKTCAKVQNCPVYLQLPRSWSSNQGITANISVDTSRASWSREFFRSGRCARFSRRGRSFHVSILLPASSNLVESVSDAYNKQSNDDEHSNRINYECTIPVELHRLFRACIASTRAT